LSTGFLAHTYILKGMGAISAAENLTLARETPSGRSREVTIATTTMRPERRVDMLLPPHGVEPPLFLSELDQVHWERPLIEHNLPSTPLTTDRSTQCCTAERGGWMSLASTFGGRSARRSGCLARTQGERRSSTPACCARWSPSAATSARGVGKACRLWHGCSAETEGVS
jgi:hypothetical protein